MEKERLQTIIDRIVERFHPEKVFLFGSRARGEHDDQSDYDILVVADMRDIPRKERAFQVRRLFPHRDFALDVIAKTPQEFERARNVPNHICRAVSQEGVVVYER